MHCRSLKRCVNGGGSHGGSNCSSFSPAMTTLGYPCSQPPRIYNTMTAVHDTSASSCSHDSF